MSFMFSYKPQYEVNEFYDSIQAIQDSYEPNEGFGKYVPGHTHFQDFQRTNSYKDTPNFLSHEDGAKRSFSSNSFQDNEEFQPQYGKPSYVYGLEDHSTMGSFSSVASLSSQTSFISNNALHSMNKSRAKVNLGKKKNPGETDYKKKYKTEVCKFWAEKGFCEFGDGCAFAHGTQEIRQKSHVSNNYKTKKCIQFHETGFCPYGARCQFIHGLSKNIQNNRNLEKSSYGEAMENPEIWITHDLDCVCMQKKTRRRLPSFQQFSGSELENKEEVHGTQSHVCSP